MNNTTHKIYYSFFKKVINNQLLFKDSTSVISTKIYSILKNLNINKNKTFININLIFNISIFRNLINIISINIIKRIKKK